MRRHRLAVGLVVVGILGCGQDEGLPDIQLPPRVTEPSTTLGSVPTAPGTAPATAGVSAAPSAPSSWEPVTGNLAGLPSECGTVSLVAAHPERDLVIAGIALQGLWALRDGSDTWEQMGTGEGSATIINRPNAIAFDPTDPARFWEAGTYNGGGAYRTDDDGATFSQLGDLSNSDRVSVDLTDPERRTMLAGIHEQPTIFRSADGGQSWQDDSSGLPDDIGFATAPLVIDAETQLLGTRSGENAGVFRTSDSGETWEQVFDEGVSSNPLVTADGTIYFVLEAGGATISSTDGGATWTERPGRISGAPSLVELADGRLATFANELVTVSADGGTTWQAVGVSMPFSPNGLAYSSARKALYIWTNQCEQGENPVLPDSIQTLAFDGG